MNEEGGDISLLSHFQIVMAEMDRRYQQQIDDLRTMLDERYVTQVKAVDAAFAAQQTAMQTALLAAEKAVQTAMTAAEKAVAKAETAAEKRFDAVNEFRAAYQDIITSQMPRAEAEQRMQALAEKAEDLKTIISKIETAVAKANAHSAGMTDGGRLLISIVGALAAAVVIIGFFLALRPR
jgi:polyribonucleotide nucleotidyltransferase